MSATKFEWQPIETAPKDGTVIDVWREELEERCCNVRFVELSPGNVFFEAAPGHSGPTCIRDATHWMPLPEPPK